MLESSSLTYQQKAEELNLSSSRYWNLLLHMVDGESEVDDKNFFLSKDGKFNQISELNATIDALLNERVFDDNSTACKFPARTKWLKKELNMQELPITTCSKYNRVLKRLKPTSATLIFPSAHINSPASMFGHTFLRINSSYDSKLLSYAINYSANADLKTENGFTFAIKGLFGGYFGKYSLLPYYEKLQEYRDTEQRDIWEYDLDFTKEEVERMVDHIWELNGTYSYYYFFTENCSYNMLWFMEVARESLHLREKFTYQVIPLETVHISKNAGIISKTTYRPSKREVLLEYEKVIDSRYIGLVKKIIEENQEIDIITKNSEIPTQQKRYLLEATIEYLEYSYAKNSMKKDRFMNLFHQLTTTRATFAKGTTINIKQPQNPLQSHRAVRASTGYANTNGLNSMLLGIRPAYHDLSDSGYGFLRGTEIEFLDIMLSYDKENNLDIYEATILTLTSLSQRSEFINNMSWMASFKFDRDYIDDELYFNAKVGAGGSWGNEFGYISLLAEPSLHVEERVVLGVGASFGLVYDYYSFMSTIFKLDYRLYDTKYREKLLDISQNFRVTQNFKIELNYKQKRVFTEITEDTKRYEVMMSWFF